MAARAGWRSATPVRLVAPAAAMAATVALIIMHLLPERPVRVTPQDLQQMAIIRAVPPVAVELVALVWATAPPLMADQVKYHQLPDLQ